MDKPHHKGMNKNADYEVEMRNFVGKDIIVTDSNNVEFTGKCLAISHPYLNVVIDSDEGIVVIRNISHMKLSR